MQSAVGTGDTLENAVKDALVRLGARPDQVTLKKLEEGGSAGLMGQAVRPFRVRATWRPEFAPPPPPPAPVTPEREAFRGAERSMATTEAPRRERSGRRDGGRYDRGERGDRDRDRDRSERPRRSSPPPDSGERFEVDDAFLAKVKQEAEWLLERMGFAATVSVQGSGDEVLVGLESTEDDAILTGRRGETRLSIQHVLSRLVNPRRGPGAHVLVDVNGYWARRREALLDRAKELAARALETGEETTTEPLSSEERRLVHRTLTADGTVVTESYGDGALKRIAIRPAAQG